MSSTGCHPYWVIVTSGMMPGALEALDEVLTTVDGGGVTASEAIEELLGAQITLRNNREPCPCESLPA